MIFFNVSRTRKMMFCVNEYELPLQNIFFCYISYDKIRHKTWYNPKYHLSQLVAGFELCNECRTYIEATILIKTCRRKCKDLNEKTISWTEKIMSNGKNELLFHKNVVCVIIMKGLGNEIMRHYPL